MLACGRGADLKAQFQLKYLMYKKLLTHMSMTLQKDMSFSLKVQIVHPKMSSYLNYLFTASFVRRI